MVLQHLLWVSLADWCNVTSEVFCAAVYPGSLMDWGEEIGSWCNIEIVTADIS